MSDKAVSPPPAAQAVAAESPGSSFTPVNAKEVTPATDVTSKASEEPVAPAETVKNTNKKTAAPKTPKTPKAPKEPKTKKRAATDDATPKSTVKRARGGGAVGNRTAIPTSRDEMSDADKMMLDWKEAGRSWKDISVEWARLNGDSKVPAGSTLPNRYSRIKAAVACVSKDHVEQLVKSVQAVDEAIEAEYKDAIAKKWTRVAKHMADNGAKGDYAAATVEKHYKKLQASGGLPRFDSATKSDASSDVAEQDVAVPSTEGVKAEDPQSEVKSVKEESSDVDAEGENDV